MRWRRRGASEHSSAGPSSGPLGGPLISVVVPVFDVADYLPAALDSLLAQTHPHLDVVVVDDGSTDSSGTVADSYAARDPRVRVVHTDNHGLGAARNTGLAHARGDLVAFLDSDDVLPPGAYATMLASLTRSGSDFVTGSIARWESAGRADERWVEPPWMRRLHTPARSRVVAAEHPEILGDVFAWNKLFRRSFWDQAGLTWPEGVRYEDQPTTTRAFLAGRFDVLPEVVYHWRIRPDGSSITQQRSSVSDLADRLATKRMALASVTAYGDEATSRVFLDRVLAGDLHRYFVEVPGCSDEWWALLRQGIGDLWGAHSLVHSGLPPVHRLAGWLVEQDRRADTAALMRYAAALGGPLPRVVDDGPPRLDVSGVPGLTDPAALPQAAVALRPDET
ncbi:MAG: glycosyltransferase family 2 protein [Nocardioides sp.]